ncbi:hypothetical protein Scani_44620 [Streptomyces caniferus]|uniref:Uncharacterized protein n=1 Tax=Streptomyces caniferus TaxID=285557 RepID=A0A640SBJ8_9ACTN|nr:hypothetical protein Scani_44620 [Streptomyces caniferus]
MIGIPLCSVREFLRPSRGVDTTLPGATDVLETPHLRPTNEPHARAGPSHARPGTPHHGSGAALTRPQQFPLAPPMTPPTDNTALTQLTQRKAHLPTKTLRHISYD